jgi:FkbM family methyltransferase
LSIDPNPKFSTDFSRIRPRDSHVVAGIAAEPRSMTYHLFDPDVFNTLSDGQAAKMIAQGRRKLGETIVPCLRLDHVVAEHLGDRPIDILNVDCEGMDLEVLQSLDLAINRPTVIVVEDAAGLVALRDGGERSETDRFLRSENYSPIAQSAWSAIFVANDWRILVERSEAFDRQSMRRGYMP